MKHIKLFKDFHSMNELSTKQVAKKRISDTVEIIGYSNGNVQIRDIRSNEVIDLYGDGSLETLCDFIKDL